MTYFSTEEICMIEMLTYYNDSIMEAVGISWCFSVTIKC